MVKFYSTMISILLLVVVSGCESFRLVASEDMKLNAWMHNRTAELAAQIADSENASETLCDLTSLSAKQSQVFVADTGLPSQIPAIYSVDDVLSHENLAITDNAMSDASRKINAWDIADSIMDFSIAVAALFGGVGAARIAGRIKDARDKTNALKEIVEGNELFKRLNPGLGSHFKQAHDGQSSATKKIVAELK